jgi:hypothetical protein
MQSAGRVDRLNDGEVMRVLGAAGEESIGIRKHCYRAI